MVHVVRLEEAVAANTSTLAQLSEWLRKPASDELPELLQTLVAAVRDNGAEIGLMRGEIGRLPAAVARAVVDGEIDRGVPIT